MQGVTIVRRGPDPIRAINDIVRAEVGDLVAFNQDRLIRAALARGELVTGGYTESITVGGSTRTVEDYRSINRWPLPDYSTSTRGVASAFDMLDAAREGIALFRRTAPRGSNSRKSNNSYRYADSLIITVDGREVPALPKASAMTAQTRIGLIDVAPHASPVEIRHHTMATIARRLISDFPKLSITFSWLPSDQVGRRYGRGTGGPVDRDVVYALPMIVITATGRSGIATRTTRRRRNRKGR